MTLFLYLQAYTQAFYVSLIMITLISLVSNILLAKTFYIIEMIIIIISITIYFLFSTLFLPGRLYAAKMAQHKRAKSLYYGLDCVTLRLNQSLLWFPFKIFAPTNTHAQKLQLHRYLCLNEMKKKRVYLGSLDSTSYFYSCHALRI